MKAILNKLKRNRLILILLILVLGVIIFGQKFLNQDNSTNPSTNTTTKQVEKGTLTSSVSASGQIQTANYLAVTTSVNGIVKKVFVTEGEKVGKDQPLMEITLDSEGQRSFDDAYASYLRSKNSLESAKSSLYAAETTYIQKKEAFQTEKEHNSYQTHDQRLSYKYAENDYLKAKSDYDNQKEAITQAQIALDSSFASYQAASPTIKAPAVGTIANILAVEGTKIQNSVTTDRSVQTVASIKQEGTPIASIDVTEVDINSVKVGQKVNMTLSSIEGKTFTGTVAGIDKIGSSSNGVTNYPVIIKFDDNSDNVLPNMSVDADIIIAQKENTLFVPTSAIKTRNNEKYVTVLKNGATQDVTVTTGIVGGTNTEILSGLNEGDTIVIDALPTTGFTSTTSNNSVRGGAGIIGIGAGTRR